MIVSVSEQSRLFLLAGGMGVLLGLIFDVFRIFRKLWKHPNFLIQLEDILYWVIVTVVMFYFMLNKDFGEIRLFSLLGVFMGMVLYFFAASPFVLRFSMAVLGFTSKVIKRTIHILLLPLKFIYKLLPIHFFYSIYRKYFSKLKRTSKKSLQKSRRYAKIGKAKLKKDLQVILKKV